MTKAKQKKTNVTTKAKKRKIDGGDILMPMLNGIAAKHKLRDLLPDALSLLCRVGKQTQMNGKIDPGLYNEIGAFVTNAMQVYKDFDTARKDADKVDKTIGGHTFF